MEWGIWGCAKGMNLVGVNELGDSCYCYIHLMIFSYSSMLLLWCFSTHFFSTLQNHFPEMFTGRCGFFMLLKCSLSCVCCLHYFSTEFSMRISPQMSSISDLTLPLWLRNTKFEKKIVFWILQNQHSMWN